MKIMVLGATGATGKNLVNILLENEHSVVAIVRSPDRLPEQARNNDNLQIVTGSVLDMHDDKLSGLLTGCDAVVSCLGHNLTLKGMYGHPRKLVADSVSKISTLLTKIDGGDKVKLILMNTTGNINKAANEKVSIMQHIVLALVRLLVPPHIDNEKAAKVLLDVVKDKIGWVAVRPDGLTDSDAVTPYTLHESPQRSAIFNPGKTSRINVADFMSRLISEDKLWNEWKFKMPVIYNRE